MHRQQRAGALADARFGFFRIEQQSLRVDVGEARPASGRQDGLRGERRGERGHHHLGAALGQSGGRRLNSSAAVPDATVTANLAPNAAASSRSNTSTCSPRMNCMRSNRRSRLARQAGSVAASIRRRSTIGMLIAESPALPITAQAATA
jgi:hypothetical protein